MYRAIALVLSFTLYSSYIVRLSILMATVKDPIMSVSAVRLHWLHQDVCVDVFKYEEAKAA